MLDAGEIELIDVRTDSEWEAGRLAGARHVEVNALTSEAGSIPRDRSVVFYCRSGNRSGMAAQAFREAGLDGPQHGRGDQRMGRRRPAARARRRRGRSPAPTSA